MGWRYRRCLWHRRHGVKSRGSKKGSPFWCGKDFDILKKIFDCIDIGTLFLPMEDKLTSKKHWIAFSDRPTGRIFVDEGAKDAILKKGKSLLPSGITKVDGTFEAGEVVHCV